MRYLVTGAAGFIGHRLVKTLLDAGHMVTAVDNLSRGRRDRLPMKESPQFTFMKWDANDRSQMLALATLADGVFHLAANPSVTESVTSPWKTTMDTLMTSINVFEASRVANVRVVFASSSAVYGPKGWASQENAVLAPISPYGVAKMTCEQVAAVMHQQLGLSYAALRFFNVYGPGQDANSSYAGVIPIFVEKLKRREPVTIYGDGKQVRDFVWVQDAVNALIEAMVNTKLNGPVNVCSGSPINLNALAKLVADTVGTPPVILYEAPRSGDIQVSIGEDSLFRKLLGWKMPPMTDLREGLQKMCN